MLHASGAGGFGRSLLAAALVGAWLAPAEAQQASLEGSWSGSGTVVLASGAKENARCRASFKRQSANSFSMKAVCATASTRIAQTADIERVSNTRFSGDFYNSEYGVSGTITISLRGDSLSASLSGGAGNAHFQLSR